MKQKSKLKEVTQSPPPQTDPLVDLIAKPLAQASLAIGRLRVAPQELSAVLPGLVGEVIRNNEAIKKGDLTNLEELLYSQALVLDAAFHKFLAMASAGMDHTELMNQRFEMITGLAAMAFKAQDASRKTLIALSEMKNPKRSTTFVKTYVDKQLNQLTLDESLTPNQPQLKEDKRAEVDTRSQREATPADTGMETLGAVNGSTNRRGKSNKCKEQH